MTRKYKLLLMIFVIFLAACGGAASEPVSGRLAGDGGMAIYAEAESAEADFDSVGNSTSPESEPTAAALNTTQTNFNQNQQSQP
ncbi:MAG: hypothetical protein GWN30_19805, partial [Gammaproteobacteria bacterium]|nr:hypothetical protein [Gammaproteobacteria bacterium]